MAKISLIQNSFEWGEVSEKVFARLDLDAYRKGSKTMENAYPFLQGGIRRRPGTVFVDELPNPNASNTVLIPHVVTAALNYLVVLTINESNAGKIRFYENGSLVTSGGSAYTIDHPYTNDQLRSIRWVQIGRSIIIVHPAHPPKILTRGGTTSWTLTNIRFLQQAQAETWYENRNIRFKIVNGLIPFRVDLGRGYGDRFTVVVAADGSITSITKNFQDPDGNGSNNTPASPDWSPLVAPADGTIIFDQTNITSATAQTYTLTCARVIGDKSYWTVSGSVSGSADGSATAIPPYDWGTDNYPATVTWFQQRLYFGGTSRNPTKVYASTLTQFSDFTEGTFDDDAFSLQIASDSYDGVTHLSAGRVLLIHTYSNEYSVVGGNSMAVTPTNFLIQPQTAHGSSTFKPMRVGNEIVYSQRGAQRLRATAYNYATDAYTAPDISLFAEHITASGIRNGTFAQDPDYISWIAMADGTLASVTLNREQNTVGWARHITDGEVLDVKAVNSSSSASVFLLVKRTVEITVGESQTTYQRLYLEKLEYNDAVWTDSSKVYGDPFGAANLNVTELTGLNHLEGKQVDVVVDRKLHAGKLVQDGKVYLDYPMTQYAVVGLPYTSKIEFLHPEVGQVVNSLAGEKISPHEIIIRFKDTINCRIDYDGTGLRDIPFNSLPYIAGSAIPFFSGDKKVHASGWRNPWNLQLVQDSPAPWTILGVIMKFTVNQS